VLPCVAAIGIVVAVSDACVAAILGIVVAENLILAAISVAVGGLGFHVALYAAVQRRHCRIQN
jgi:fructose-specific phosphotransferase system IIC component